MHHRIQPNKNKLVYARSHYSKSADKVKYYSIKVGCVAWMLYIYQVVYKNNWFELHINDFGFYWLLFIWLRNG